MEPEEKMEFKTRLGESCFLEEGVDVGGGGEGGGGVTVVSLERSGIKEDRLRIKRNLFRTT